MPQPGTPDAFVEAVLDIVAAIPEGCALSYGEIAAMLGSRAARQVGRIMAHHGGDVPWWRVVRASGEVAPGHDDAALEHYRREGTPLRWASDGSGFRVDMRRARPRD
ncbi:MGMT family protein [Salinibacterium sp. ZJ77]|uniref:MGMT family protein n=1 Tax=Salinibacterium sp. ZJ77 TaxID=2708337 RepID=UPI0014220E63|nr:MGMT family protein [Salinibacterium sp. ZJ77]